MRALNARRQSDSAKHYLDVAAASSALRTTLLLAAESVDFPVAMINIIDDAEQRTVVVVGMPDVPPRPRSETLCATVVDSGRPMMRADLQADEAGRKLPGDTLGLGAYVGIPLTGREEVPIGALCLLDFEPHSISPRGLRRLEQFAAVVQEQLELLRRLGNSPPRSDVRAVVEAIDEKRIVPWFQPIVDLRTDCVVAYEALARWDHPTRGILPPSEFLAVAEDSDLIVDLDLSILSQAAGIGRDWWSGEPQARTTVNISGRHFRDAACVDRLHQSVKSAGMPPEGVVLELTETSVFDVSDRTVEVLTELRELGFGVALDDFGVGCSTLDHLVRLPCDLVKIDAATSAAMGTRSGNAVIRAVAGLAKELSISVVIEGIESAEHAEWARDLGCTHGQGYLWAPPMPAISIGR